MNEAKFHRIPMEGARLLVESCRRFFQGRRRSGVGPRGWRGSGQRTPSEIVGYLVLVAIMLFASIEAAHVVGFQVLEDLLTQFNIFAAQVIVDLIIFAIGLHQSNVAARAVRASGAAQSNLLALAACVSILVLAGAMALRQMGLASDIINLAFGLLLGAVAVAAALAFGFGGREAAGREVDNWLNSLRPS